MAKKQEGFDFWNGLAYSWVRRSLSACAIDSPRAHGQVWLIVRHTLLWNLGPVQVDDEDTTHEDTTLTELREILAEHLIDDLTLVWAR